MDPLTSLLNESFSGKIEKVEFKAGAIKGIPKAFTMYNPRIRIDDDDTIHLIDNNYIIDIPYDNNIVHWDYETGKKHIIDVGFKKIGIAYTYENLFR